MMFANSASHYPHAEEPDHVGAGIVRLLLAVRSNHVS